MATGQISSTPSAFNFLKEGLLLPNHNRRLFAGVFTVIVASSCLLFLVNNLAVLRDENEIDLDTKLKALNSTDPISPTDILQLTTQMMRDDPRAIVRRIFGVIVRSAIQIVVLSAAVATYSGEQLTFGSLLGQVKTQLKGPVLTLALVHALEVASFKLQLAMGGLLMFLTTTNYFGLTIVVTLLVVFTYSFILLVSFSFLCPLSVVVAVAEPGCHGTGALGRAWRLVKGKRGRAMVFISVTAALGAALISVHNLAKRCEQLTSMAAGGLLLEFLYSILTSAVQLFETCAMAAFYYECKGRSTQASAVEYVKVSID